MINYS